MKEKIMDEQLGEITYNESFLTGKKGVLINGNPLQVLRKDTFKLNDEIILKVKGNVITGVTIVLEDRKITLIEKAQWYEYVLMCISFLILLIWGNVVALVEIVPIVGGAIGGLINGFLLPLVSFS